MRVHPSAKGTEVDAASVEPAREEEFTEAEDHDIITLRTHSVNEQPEEARPDSLTPGENEVGSTGTWACSVLPVKLEEQHALVEDVPVHEHHISVEHWECNGGEDSTEGADDPTAWKKDADGEYISPLDDEPLTVNRARGDSITYPGVVRLWDQAVKLAKQRRKKLLPPCPLDKKTKSRRALHRATPEWIGSRVGSSVGLYFKALQSLGRLFIVISMVYAPYLWLCVSNEQQQQSFTYGNFSYLAATTLGALLPSGSKLHSMEEEQILQLASVLDIVAILIALCGMLKLRRQQEKAIEAFDERVLTLSDYTAIVHVPLDEIASDELANEIADFFESYREREGKIKLSVERVCLGTTCNELIEMFSRRSRHTQQKRRNHALENATKGEKGERAKRVFKRKADNTSDAIVREWASISEEYRMTKAFVTFSTTEDMSLALNEFPESDLTFSYAFLYKRSRIFRPPDCELLPHHPRNRNGGRPAAWGDGFKMTASRATEANNVIWENLEYTRTTRAFATFSVSMLVTLLLVISFALLVGSSVLDRRLTPNVSAERSFGTEGKLECNALVGYNAAENVAPENVPTHALDYMKSQAFGPFEGAGCRQFVTLATYSPATNCLVDSNDTKMYTPADPPGLSSDKCRCEATFCYQIFCNRLGFNTALIQSPQIGQGNSTIDARSYCLEFHQSFGRRIVLRCLSALVSIIINMCLRYAVSWLAKLEKHPTMDSMQASIASKLTAMQVVNMMLISIVAYGKIPGVDSGLLKLGIFFGGEFHDFDQGWYSDTGTNLLLIVLLQSVGPQSMELGYSAYMWYRRKTESKKMRSQDDLDELHEPRPFQLAERAGQLNSFLFIAIALSGGMPLAAVATICYCYYAIYVDRLLLFKDCKEPESGGKVLDAITWSTMKWAIWLHSMLSMWMFGRAYLIAASSMEEQDEEVGAAADSGLQLEDRLVNSIAGPHALLFFALCFWLFAKPLVQPFVMLLRWCNCFKAAKAAQDNPPFEEAVQRQGRLDRISTVQGVERSSVSHPGVLPWRGPTSYAMVGDPRYRNVFAAKPSDIASEKIRELMNMLPDLQRHDREGFTVFDTREYDLRAPADEGAEDSADAAQK